MKNEILLFFIIIIMLIPTLTAFELCLAGFGICNPTLPQINPSATTNGTGTPGTPGVDGTNGTNGVDGTNGTNGANGSPGANGVDGTNGTNGVNGTNGINGTNGTFTGILNTTQFYNISTTYSINQSWLTNFTQTIVISYNYLTSWLIPDTTNGYLYNDSTKIYFNDTRLNNTIFSEGIRLGFNNTFNSTYNSQIVRIDNLNTTIINSNNSWTSTYNSTYDAKGTGNILGTGTSGYIPLWNNTNTINNSVIYQNGTKIGIGTTNPLYNLDVSGTFRATSSFIVPLVYATNNLGAYAMTSGGAYYGRIGPTTKTGNGGWYLGHYTDTTSNAGTPVLSWTGENNVGIGTTSPSNTLDVRGVGNFSGTIYINNVTDISTYANNLTNVAFTNQSNTFTGNQIFNNNVLMTGSNAGLNLTNFGYSSTYKVLKVGSITSGVQTSAISLGYDPSTNPSGSFNGNEIIIPNSNGVPGMGIIAPDANNSNYIEVLKVVNDSIRTGGSKLNINTTSGNVGIGTTTPNSQVEIWHDTAAQLSIHTNRENAGDLATLYFSGVNSPTTRRKGAIFWQANGVGNGLGDMIFANDGAADSGSAQIGDAVMTINSSGKVGIGTTSPGAKLDVASVGESIRISGSGTTANSIRVLNTGNDVYFGSEGSSAGGFFTGALAYSSVIYSNTPIQNIIGGTSRTIIDGSGNFGIGTTSPQAKLDVRGVGNFSGTIYINNDTDISTLGMNYTNLALTNQSNTFNGNQTFNATRITISSSPLLTNSGYLGLLTTYANVTTSSTGYRYETNKPSQGIKFTAIINGTNATLGGIYGYTAQGNDGIGGGLVLTRVPDPIGSSEAYALVIQPNGRVVIGGTAISPASQTLDVAGGINMTGTSGNIYGSGTGNNYLNGSLGIGTTSPRQIFHVHKQDTSSGIQITNSFTGTSAADGFEIDQDYQGDIWMTNHENSSIFLQTNELTRMVIANNGKVGIGFGGLILPTQALEVKGNINTTQGNITLDGGNAGLIANMTNKIMLAALNNSYSVSIYVNNTEAIKIIPKGSDDYIIMNTSSVQITNLSGSGNAYVCVNATGHIYRSGVTCV